MGWARSFGKICSVGVERNFSRNGIAVFGILVQEEAKYLVYLLNGESCFGLNGAPRVSLRSVRKKLLVDVRKQ
jgi:hypothetical protein